MNIFIVLGLLTLFSFIPERTLYFQKLTVIKKHFTKSYLLSNWILQINDGWINVFLCKHNNK